MSNLMSPSAIHNSPQAGHLGVPLGSLPRMKQHQHECRNCGCVGHVYKACTQPTLSFGLICYRIGDDGTPKYLMIQRKDSLSFMEFIRGKYDLNNAIYMHTMFSTMTRDERRMIQESTFETLWNYTWVQTHGAHSRSGEYLECKRKFDTLRTGYMNNGKFIELQALLRATTSNYSDPEWGFPKGRRKIKETDLDCAVREFCEETGCESNDFHVLITNPYRETFLGTNQVPYSHVYYLASMQSRPSKEPYIDRSNIQQIREVRSVGWFSFNEVIARIRDHNWERKNIFVLAHKKVCELIEHAKTIKNEA